MRRSRRTLAAIAAVIVEPVVGNMGVVVPRPGFLEGLRELCSAEGALLIFDEVMTGFRVARGGAQERYRHPARPDDARQDRRRGTAGRRLRRPARPDGARVAGRADLPGRHAVGQSAVDGRGARDARCDRGRSAVLRAARARSGAALEDGLAAAVARIGAPCTIARVGSMWTLFFAPERVDDWTGAARCDTARFARFFQAHARARDLPRAVAVRSELHLGGAHAGRYRDDDCRGRRGAGDRLCLRRRSGPAMRTAPLRR